MKANSSYNDDIATPKFEINDSGMAKDKIVRNKRSTHMQQCVKIKKINK